MGVDGSIPGSTCQILSLSVGNVFSVSLDVSLGQSEVQDEDLVSGLVQPDAEIIWLNVPVNEVPVVHILDPGDHLVDQHQHCLQ